MPALALTLTPTPRCLLWATYLPTYLPPAKRFFNFSETLHAFKPFCILALLYFKPVRPNYDAPNLKKRREAPGGAPAPREARQRW